MHHSYQVPSVNLGLEVYRMTPLVHFLPARHSKRQAAVNLVPRRGYRSPQINPNLVDSPMYVLSLLNTTIPSLHCGRLCIVQPQGMLQQKLGEGGEHNM